jgi:hypothetical protein
MANKTAVEFVAYELMNLDIAYEMGLEKNEFHKLRQEIIKKAKEMEKQQIMDAYNDAEDKCEYFIEEHAWQRHHLLSENYYKQTFKSE